MILGLSLTTMKTTSPQLAYDADATDMPSYNITYGNNAKLLILTSELAKLAFFLS